MSILCRPDRLAAAGLGEKGDHGSNRYYVVRFRILPPAYTRDAAYEGPLPQGGISALAGTVIEVQATSNRPLKRGTVDIVEWGPARIRRSLQPATTDGRRLSRESRAAARTDRSQVVDSFHLTVSRCRPARTLRFRQRHHQSAARPVADGSNCRTGSPVTGNPLGPFAGRLNGRRTDYDSPMDPVVQK